MNLLTIEKLTKSYTDRILFDNVTFGINEGDKVGVIGVNGTGKSTLLKIISGLEEGDSGTVTKGNNIKITYLPQNPSFHEKLTILENVLEGAVTSEGHWNLEGEAKSMLNKLGIPDYNGDIASLSGGQKKRVALVRTLLHPADILALDEPTNHLDNEMAEWLEDYLNKYRGALVMVTHDRYFLDKVTNKILEIDKASLYSYTGNYSKFLELKAEREEMEIAAERKKKSLYRMDLEWMMRGARARSTKQKAHIQRFEELRDREKIAETATIEMNSLSKRLGKKTLEVHEISKSYGDKILFNNFSYIFLKDDRIGIIGKNGCGKSTLLKILNGVVKPDTGDIQIGQTVKIGYFSQENEYMDESLRVIDYIREVGEYIETSDGSASASQMLERFLFTGAMQYSYINKLSGGEKRRLYLLRILMEAPNILILDEPTNDLDIQTLSILEDYLDSFHGIVITVSHDRYFLDRVVDRIFSFEGSGMIRQYEGGFTDYKAAHDRMEPMEPEQGSESAPKKKKEKAFIGKVPEKKTKFSYNEQREYETIDADVGKLEDELSQIEQEILLSASNYVKLNELMDKKEQLEEQLEVKMDRWVYLNDLAALIEGENNE